MTPNTVTKPKYRRYSSEERSAMLIEAGLTCLARGGILGFTIDNICREAGVSRGLITHHFKSKDGLLAAIYSTMYSRSLSVFAGRAERAPEIRDVIEAEFRPDVFRRDNIMIWLALWGEIATNPVLGKEHRKNYSAYRRAVADAVKLTAAARGCSVDAEQLAVMIISLIDGLWVENCIAPDLMSPERAKRACYQMLAPFLGEMG